MRGKPARQIGLFLLLLFSAVKARTDLVPVPALGVRIERGFRISPYAGPDLANDIYAMTLDSVGNVVVTSQGYVKTLYDTDGDGIADSAILFANTPKGGMGLCFDGVDLYFSGDGGLYRMEDRDRDGAADGAPQKIMDYGTSEHGGHAIRKGPDGWFYLIGGNDAGFGSQHIGGPTAPIRAIEGGALLRISPDMTRIEPVAHGFRNPYDFDFNAFGDLFTYDSDVESDFFLPWYTPTRFYHIAHAGHHGWRLNGWRRSWNRPSYYADTVDTLAEIGRGSPTGVLCYRHYQFPPRYRNGFFALDWTFGRVYFSPLVPAGASYQASPELFLEPMGAQGLAPTDLVVTPDGSLLLSIGGRKTRGAIYRIDYPAAGNPQIYASNWLQTASSEAEAVLNAPQPLDAWSRAYWVPVAVRLGPAPFAEAVMDGRLGPVPRIRAIEVLTELHGGLPPDAAALALQANSPLVRARVAWSLGRVPRPNSAPILVALARDPDSAVRRAALDSLGDMAFTLSPAMMQQALAPNLAHPEKRIRQAAARLATYLPEPAFKALWTQLERGAAQARLTAGLALLWRGPKNVVNPPAVEAALSILSQARTADLRLQAVRLMILGLGDYHLNDPAVEVYTAYEPAATVPPELAQRIRRGIESIFPSGDSFLDAETSRLLAIVEDDKPFIAGKVLAMITEKSFPTVDFHYLTVLSRLKGPLPTNSSARVAHAILALDRKLEGLERRPKQNWSVRLAEVVQNLLARDPKLAAAMIADREFPKPAHVVLAGSLGPSYSDASAQRFMEAVERNPGFVWSAQLIDLLSSLPSERIFPLLRRQWPNAGLRDEILLRLAQLPALEDRDKFVTGLSSMQSDVVRASTGALLQLPRDESGKAVVPLLRFLRRTLNQPEQQAARAEAVKLLNFETSQSFKVQENGTDATALKRAYAGIFDWFGQHEPLVLRQLDADDGQDASRWSFLLKSVKWERGDAARGENIFRERGCQTCHASATPLGPDLAGVAGRLSVNDLFNAIIFPSRDIAGPYRTTTFRTRDGQNYTGIVVFESADGVIVQTGAESTVRLPENDIIWRQPSNISLMPSGLLAGLQPQSLADLYSYLTTLRPEGR